MRGLRLASRSCSRYKMARLLLGHVPIPTVAYHPTSSLRSVSTKSVTSLHIVCVCLRVASCCVSRVHHPRALSAAVRPLRPPQLPKKSKTRRQQPTTKNLSTRNVRKEAVPKAPPKPSIDNKSFREPLPPTGLLDHMQPRSSECRRMQIGSA